MPSSHSSDQPTLRDVPFSAPYFHALLAGGVILLNVFIVALVLLSIFQSHRQHHERAEITTQNLTQTLESEIGGAIKADDVALFSVIDEYNKQHIAGGIDGNMLNAYIERVRRRMPEIDALRITDAQGVLIYGNGVVPAAKVSLADRPHFVRLRDDPKAGLVISKPQLSRVNQKWVIVLTRRIDQPDGAFGGMVFAAITLEHFSRAFATLNIGPRAAIALRDQELGLIVRYPQMQDVASALGNKPVAGKFREMVEAGNSAGTFTANAGSDNVERTYSYRKIGSYPLYILVGLAVEDYLADWRNEAAHQAELAALFALTTFLAAWLIHRIWKRGVDSVAALAESEERQRLALDASNQAWFDVDLQTGRVAVDAEYPRMIGYDPNDFQTDMENWLARVHPDDRDALIAALQICFRDGGPHSMEYRRQTKTGDWKWIRSVGKIVQRDAEDQATRMIGIHTDITEQKLAELALMDSEAYSKALFSYSDTPLVIMDPDTGTFTDCNEAAVRIYQLKDRNSVLGKSPLDVSSPTQYDGTPSADAARFHIAAARTDGLHVFEWRHQRPDGEIWDAEVHLMSFRYAGHDLIQFSLRDITAQKVTEAENWQRANLDALTNLTNRSLCLDRLEMAIAQAQRSGEKIGVLFLDLDGFKGINDTLGHALGDELLKETARRLERCVREQDTVARFGGDEFVIVAQGIAERTDLSQVAEQVVAALHKPFSLTETSHQISCSVGMSVFPDDADMAGTLIACADQAMYEAKRAGKNQYCFYAKDVAR